MNTFIFLKFLGTLALPPASLVPGFVVAGILAVLRYRRTARLIAVLTVVQLLVLSTAPVADMLIWPLQRQALAEARAAKPCCYDAIVVLGGAIAGPELPYNPNPALTPSSDRLWQASRLYKRGVAPKIIVSGGNYDHDGPTEQSEARYMRGFLVDLGVPPEAIEEEGSARNTIENIVNVRAMVKNGSVALVTSAYHMPRALRLAREYGLNASAFPTEWHSESGGAPWSVFLPSGSAMATSGIALWGYMALLFDGRKANKP